MPISQHEVQDVLKLWDAAGARVVRNKRRGTYRVFPPNGQPAYSIHTSISDSRAHMAMRSWARRNGLPWPGEYNPNPNSRSLENRMTTTPRQPEPTREQPVEKPPAVSKKDEALAAAEDLIREAEESIAEYRMALKNRDDQINQLRQIKEEVITQRDTILERLSATEKEQDRLRAALARERSLPKGSDDGSWSVPASEFGSLDVARLPLDTFRTAGLDVRVTFRRSV